jgi:hypothetical protein
MRSWPGNVLAVIDESRLGLLLPSLDEVMARQRLGCDRRVTTWLMQTIARVMLEPRPSHDKVMTGVTSKS